MIGEYHRHKYEYFKKYNPDVYESLKYVEQKENWTLKHQIDAIDELFDLLPAFCEYPIKHPYMVVINQLIPILAYMPLTDMFGSLHYLGTKNSDWGYAIHKIAYEYSQDLNVSIKHKTDDQYDELLIASKQIQDRMTMLSKIAVINIIGEI